MTDAAKQYIIDNAYDPIYGARPLKRFCRAMSKPCLAERSSPERLALRTRNEEMCKAVIDAENGGTGNP